MWAKLPIFHHWFVGDGVDKPDINQIYLFGRKESGQTSLVKWYDITIAASCFEMLPIRHPTLKRLVSHPCQSPSRCRWLDESFPLWSRWIADDCSLFPIEKLSQWSPESKDVVQMIVKFIDGVGCRVSWEGVCPGAKHQATWKHSERCEVFQSFEMHELYFESLVCSEFIPKPVRCSCSGWRGLEFQHKENSTMQWGKKPNIET